MSLPIAESYARDPKLYQRTFCYSCGDYFPVDEFVWIENDGRVTDNRLGS